MKNFLVALDGSPVSRTVFRAALVLAEKVCARVVAVSVTPEYAGSMNRFCLHEMETCLDGPFIAILDEAKKYAALKNLQIDIFHRRGRVFEEIVNVACEVDACLIILGCARRFQVERMLLGRTMVQVVQAASCDVLMIPEDVEIEFGTILMAVNDSVERGEAEHRCFEIAQNYGSDVVGFFVIDLPADRLLRYGIVPEAEERAMKVLADFSAYGKEYDVDVTRILRCDSLDRALVKYATEQKIDLIIVEAVKRAGVLEMIGGSPLERLVSNTPCPVLVVHNQDITDFHSRDCDGFITL